LAAKNPARCQAFFAARGRSCDRFAPYSKPTMSNQTDSANKAVHFTYHIIDGNHPFAGQTVTCHAIITEIRDANHEEIAGGQVTDGALGQMQ